jgi:nucleotide-binding universal stress UspA family protein
MLQSVLFATDFLPATADVQRVATRLATVFDSHVTLLHVLDPSLTSPDGLLHQREHAAVCMRELAEQLALYKVMIDESAIAVGSPADVIVRKAQEIDADLVLLGAGGASRFDRPAGPTAEAVLQHAVQPVLAVRPGAPQAEFHRILCPVDQSAVSQRGLQNAIRLARAFQSHLVIVSVVPRAGWVASALETGKLKGATDEHERQWHEEFDQFLENVAFDNTSWEKEIRIGVPHQEIAAAARDHRADVIVMGATGRTGLARMLIGSVTRRMLQHLPCSLLTVKGADVVEELSEGDVRTINLLMGEGREMLAAGCHAQAAGKFRQVLAHNPFHLKALEGLAQAYSKLDRAEEAIHYQNRANMLRHGLR